MTKKQITSANQLIDGKQYVLVQGEITVKVTFSEVVHPEPQPGYCTTEEDEPSVALALLIDKDSKFDGYKFSIHLNDYRGCGVHVDVFNLRNSKVTNNWDGMTYLGFDKKCYSYELTKKEYYYLEPRINTFH